jgi:RNA polymerase sigma-70 factor, ECF subfamily
MVGPTRLCRVTNGPSAYDGLENQKMRAICFANQNLPRELRPVKSKAIVVLRTNRVGMSFLDEVGPEQAFDPFVAFRKAFGFVPNLLRAQSALPRVIAAHAKIEEAVCFRDGAISRIHKERILLSIAADRRDDYWVALDTELLISLGVREDHIDNLLNDREHAGLLPPDRALLGFCLKLSRYSALVGFEDLEALRAQGWKDEAILEAVAVTALAVYRCTLSVALRPEPDVKPRNLCRKILRGASEAVPSAAPANSRRKAGRTGPYVPAPYLSPITFERFAVVQKSHGFIPNFFRAQTLRPDLLEAELDAVGTILLPEDTLTRVQKESILLAVSAANLNSYCVAVHCNMLRGLGLSAEEADQIAVDYHLSDLSKGDVALLDFAVKLGTRFSECTPEDAVTLASFGFKHEQILEAVVVTALNNFANTVQMGLGIEPDFEPPSIFAKNKVNLSGAATTLIPREDAVHLVETSQDADAELVAQSQCGNLDAFEELARRHTQLIYRALIAILGDAADAQDAMQDTLLSAFKHIGGFQGRSKFSTWLVSIARNAALQQLRGRRNTESLDQNDTEDDCAFRPRQIAAWQENPEQSHSRTEIRQLVEKGLLRLPAKYRVIVMLRDIEQFSTDDVARQLGLSVPAVKTRLLRGRLMLREWLSPHLAASRKGAAQ